jgi:hypothetical protein
VPCFDIVGIFGSNYTPKMLSMFGVVDLKKNMCFKEPI